MNACVTKAKYILPLLNKEDISYFILHNKLIKLLTKIHAKIHTYFKTTIWVEQDYIENL